MARGAPSGGREVLARGDVDVPNCVFLYTDSFLSSMYEHSFINYNIFQTLLIVGGNKACFIWETGE